MGGIIIDGTGGGYKVEVDANNRLSTLSVTQDVEFEESLKGNSYNFNTGTINLTSGDESAVAYIKNTGTTNLIIAKIFYLIGNSTGGSGDMFIDVIRNPTAGTIISSGTAQSPVNRNFGSNKTLTVTALKGAEGQTITDGSAVIQSIFSGSAQRAALTVGTLILTPGASIGVTMEPPTNNTSMNVQCAFEIWEESVTSA